MSDNIWENLELLHKTCVGLAVLQKLEGNLDSHQFRITSKGVHIYEFFNGGGDTLDIAFCPEGAVCVEFDHESEDSPWAQNPERVLDRMFENLPKALHFLVTEAENLAKDEGDDDAFPGKVGGEEHPNVAHATDASFWTPETGKWDGSESEDSCGWLSERALDFADFQDMDFPDFEEEAMRKVLDHAELDDALIESFGTKADAKAIRAYAESVGYGKPYPYPLNK